MSAGNEPHVSGALACGLRDVVAELVGASVVERALTRVSAEVQSSYQHATAIGWVPIRVLETVFGAIAYETGTTVSELHTRVARTSIDRTFRTFWRVLLRMTTDHALVARTPSIFARSY